ncbi:MAG: hypothetical protein OK454_02180, partial [Thaumarchaeota archaeon]|nr:hypothetical protein [Nitrososphaerota archaeon]
KPDLLVVLQRYGGAVAAEGKEGPNPLAKLGRELAVMYAPDLILGILKNADDRFYDYTCIGVVRYVEYQMIVPALQRRGFNEMQAKNLAAEIVNKGMDLSRIEWDKGRGYKVDPGAIADVFTQLYIPFTGVAPDAKPDLSYDWKLREHQKREKETGTFQNFDPSVMPPLPEDAPQSVSDITTVDPKDRQRKLDQLLDQYSAEQDPERKKQIEEQMRSLKASMLGRWLLRRAAGKLPAGSYTITVDLPAFWKADNEWVAKSYGGEGPFPVLIPAGFDVYVRAVDDENVHFVMAGKVGEGSGFGKVILKVPGSKSRRKVGGPFFAPASAFAVSAKKVLRTNRPECPNCGGFQNKREGVPYIDCTNGCAEKGLAEQVSLAGAPTQLSDVKTINPDVEFDKLIQQRDRGQLTPEQFNEKSRRLFGSRLEWMSRVAVYGGDTGWSGDVTWWHGSPSGDLRGTQIGLHLGSYEAAKQALEARIGVPVEGEWDGTRTYGETLLAGRKTLAKKGNGVWTGLNSEPGDEDHYPIPGKAVFSDGTPVPMDARPILAEYRIVGDMTNSPWKPHGDEQANGLMARQIKQNRAKRGFFYENISEDEGSISAVVPNGAHLERVSAAGAGMERTAKDAKRDSSCVMVNITDPKLKEAFSEITAMVDDDDVYDPPEDAKYGKENNFHVTCKYGLSTGDPDDVRPLIEGFGPIKAKITGVSFFRKEEKEYDVLKFDVDSDDLARLRKKIEDATEWTDENPKFHAHATIAYLKRGRAEKYCD